MQMSMEAHMYARHGLYRRVSFYVSREMRTSLKAHIQVVSRTYTDWFLGQLCVYLSYAHRQTIQYTSNVYTLK